MMKYDLIEANAGTKDEKLATQPENQDPLKLEEFTVEKVNTPEKNLFQ